MVDDDYEQRRALCSLYIGYGLYYPNKTANYFSQADFY